MGRVLLGVQIGLGPAHRRRSRCRRRSPLSLVLLFVGGMFFMALFSISFSLVQLTVPDDAARPRGEHLHGGAARRRPDRRRWWPARWPTGSRRSSVMAVNGVILARRGRMVPRLPRRRHPDGDSGRAITVKMPPVARVLVVEDSPDIADLIRHYLERAGHTVDHARIGT